MYVHHDRKYSSSCYRYRYTYTRTTVQQMENTHRHTIYRWFVTEVNGSSFIPSFLPYIHTVTDHCLQTVLCCKLFLPWLQYLKGTQLAQEVSCTVCSTSNISRLTVHFHFDSVIPIHHMDMDFLPFYFLSFSLSVLSPHLYLEG